MDGIKSVVITGSSRGLGYEMAGYFRKAGWNVLLNGVNPERLDRAVQALQRVKGRGFVKAFVADMASPEQIEALADYAVKECDSVDIWINNAGVNQPMKPFWELTVEEITALLDIDLKGAILGSRAAVRIMKEQPSGGYIYNVEGYGSNDAMMTGLNLYGTAKRAVTHFTVALAKEAAEAKCKIKIGRLSPGIMLTDFTDHALGGKEKIELPEKVQKVYGILGDQPDAVARYMVSRMLHNEKNNVHIQWLTTRKAICKFMTHGRNKA